jgi:hypothetical protein
VFTHTVCYGILQHEVSFRGYVVSNEKWCKNLKYELKV